MLCFYVNMKIKFQFIQRKGQILEKITSFGGLCYNQLEKLKNKNVFQTSVRKVLNVFRMQNSSFPRSELRNKQFLTPFVYVLIFFVMKAILKNN